MTYRNHVLISLAQLSPQCFGCGKRNEGDVVAAHRNRGKGLGIKVDDFLWAGLCGTCHSDYDQGHTMDRDEKDAFWLRAFVETMRWAWTAGHIAAHVEPVAQPIPKPKVKRVMPKGRKIASGAKLQSRGFDKSDTPRKIQSRGFQKRPAKT